MKRVLTTFILLMLGSSSFADVGKKGIAIIPGSINKSAFSKSIDDINPSWYYNWGVWPEKSVNQKIDFVPMVGDLKSLKNINKVKDDQYVLLFNEPDGKANYIDPVKAAKLSIGMMKQYHTIQFITPAAQNPWSNWMPKYLHVINDPNYKKFNIFAMHWYGKADINKFENDIEQIHHKYNRNIWLTEFAIVTDCNKSEKENDIMAIEFMSKALIFLEKTDYIKRYSWFSPRYKFSSGCELNSDLLFNEDGTLTKLGSIYAKGAK